MKYLYGLFLLFTFINCDTSPRSQAESTYFGGKIIKPNSDYVVLYKEGTLIDSIKLNSNNQFMIKLDSVEDGLYNFYHDPEYQYVHIEKGDSILIRLNTMEFDESLVFSGRGELKNNFMIDMYLMNEKDEKYINNLYRLPQKRFVEHLDSLRTLKLLEFEKLAENKTYELSESASKITKATIDFPYYIKMERYPRIHNNVLRIEGENQIPTDFHSYREQIDLNDQDLKYYRPYRNYVLTHLSNLAYGDFKKGSLTYNIKRLELIDSIIDIDDLKNDLLRYVAFEYLLKNKYLKENEEFLIKFFKTSTSNTHDQEINTLYHSITFLQPGLPMPKIDIVNASNTPTKLENVRTNRPTFYYFWTSTQKRNFQNTLVKISQLKRDFPHIDFVGINLDTDHRIWLHNVKEYQLDTNAQFRTKNTEKMSRQLVINHMNRAILLNSEGIIVEGLGSTNNISTIKQLLKDL